MWWSRRCRENKGQNHLSKWLVDGAPTSGRLFPSILLALVMSNRQGCRRPARRSVRSYCAPTIRQLLVGSVGIILLRSTQSMINSRTSSLERYTTGAFLNIVYPPPPFTR